MTERSILRREYLTPRYLLTWCVLGGLRSSAFVPLRLRIYLGYLLGAGLYLIMGERRRIAATNLRLCFPDKTVKDRRGLLFKHFLELGVGFTETGAAWWSTNERLQPYIHAKGLEHIEQGLERGNGVLILSPHFTHMDMTWRMGAVSFFGHALYRKHKNGLFNDAMLGARERFGAKLFERENVRALLRSLKENRGVFYAGDQDHGLNHGVMVEFFGHPAATLTTPSRIARSTGAAVVSFFAKRLPGGRGYELVFSAPLDNFPSDDDEADARRLNTILEAQVRECPEQYLWVHRRFKTQRPPKNLYEEC